MPERFAYLTVTHEDREPRTLHADTIELDATGRSFEDLKQEARRRLTEYSWVRLVSAVLTQWSDKDIPQSAHPSQRIPMNYCFQRDELT